MSACILLLLFFSVCCPLSVFPCRMRVVVLGPIYIHSKTLLPDFALLYLYNNFEPLKVVKMKACAAGCWQCGLIMWCVKNGLWHHAAAMRPGRSVVDVLRDGLNQISLYKEAGSEIGIRYKTQMIFCQSIFLTAKVKFLVPCFDQQCSSFKLQGYFIGL